MPYPPPQTPYGGQQGFNPYMADPNLGQVNNYRQYYMGQTLNDMNQGLAAGQQMYGTGSLGRLDTTPYSNVTNMYASRLGGYTSGEWGALRNQAALDTSRQFAGQDASLAAARAQSGIRGATAMAAQQHEDRNRANAVLASNRNLMISNIQAKQQALGQYQQSLMGGYGLQEYNLAQAAKEKQGQMAYQMGYAQLGSAANAAAGRMVASQQAEQEQQAADQRSQSKM